MLSTRLISPSLAAGETGKKGAFRGGQPMAITGIVRHAAPIHVSASELLSNFAREVIMAGGYLNSDDLVHGLRDKIEDLHQLAMFKSIQGVNKVIHAAVQCYWQGRSIRIYRELERFVIKQVAGYKQMQKEDIPDNFKAFGMGNLLRNDVVMKFFNFAEHLPSTTTTATTRGGGNGGDGSSLPNVTSADVLQCIQEFIAKNRNLGRPDEKLEEKFKDYLRRYFGTNLLGVDVEFKSLFHSTTQTRSTWFRELKEAREEYAVQYKKALQGALQRMIEQAEFAGVRALRTSTSTGGGGGGAGAGEGAGTEAAKVTYALVGDEKIYRAAGVDVQATLGCLNSLGVSSLNGFLHVASHLCTQTHANQNSRMGLAVEATVSAKGKVVPLPKNALGLTALFVDTSTVISGVGGGAGGKVGGGDKLQLRSVLAKKPRECIVSCVLGLMSHLLATPPVVSAAAADATQSSSEVAPAATGGMDPPARVVDAVDPVRVWLGAKLSDGVPAKCLQALQELLKRFIQADQFFDIGASSSSAMPDCASVDWNSVRVRVEDLLNGESVMIACTPMERTGNKGAVALGAGDTLATATMTQCMRVENYLGVVTAVILFRRVLDTVVTTTTTPVPGGGASASTTARKAVPSLQPGASDDTLASFVADRVTHQLTTSAASDEILSLTERCGPMAAFLNTLRGAEAEITAQLSVPAFECTRSGGSFLHLLVRHLTLAATAEGSSGGLQQHEQKLSSGGAVEQASVSLLIALQSLHSAIFPVVEVDTTHSTENTSGGADAHGEDGAQAGRFSVEEALQHVQQELSAVLTTMEFADADSCDTLTGTVDAEGPASSSSVPVLELLLSVLLDAESRFADSAQAFQGAGRSQVPSFLRLVHSIAAENGELNERLDRLLLSRCDLALANGSSVRIEEGGTNAVEKAQVRPPCIQACYDSYHSCQKCVLFQ